MAGERGLAEQIRTGLDVASTCKAVKQNIEPLDRMLYRKPVRQHVKEFAILFATIFVLIAGFLIWKQRAPLWSLGLLIGASALTWSAYKAPQLLHPIWKGWMRFAEILGTIVTSLILLISWVFLVIPMALLLRVFQKKVMDCSYKAPVQTYWENRDPKKSDFKLLINQY